MTTKLVVKRALPRADRTLAWPLVVVAGVAIAIVLGVLAARSLAPREKLPPAPSLVHVGNARFVISGESRPATLRSTVAGLDARSAVALEPYPGAPTRVLAMFAPADDASLIPKALRDVLAAPPPGPASTRLAGWPSWHYPPMLTRVGHRTVDVTVIPTTRGVFALACLSPLAVLDAGCTPDVESVSIVDAVPLVPSASLALALHLPAALRPLDRARVNGRAALDKARSPAAQSATARRLAGAYSAAATSLRRSAGDAAGPLAHRLVAAGGAYAQLSAAASDRAAVRFNAARAKVNAAEAGVARVVAEVRRRDLPRVARLAPASPGTPDVASAPRTLALALVLVIVAAGSLLLLRGRTVASRVGSWIPLARTLWRRAMR